MDTNADTALSVRVLGPPRAFLDERELELGPPRQKAVFAVLALRAGHPVSREELIDAVWGEELPGNPAGGVHTYVAGLRRALEPARSRREPGRRLVSQGSGYVLRLAADRTDAAQFEAHRSRGLRAAASGDPAGAAAAFDRALALFDGTALAGVPGPFAEAQRNRFAERRRLVVEERLDAVLAQGRHEDVVGDLRALTREQPLRERLWYFLMIALYRSGRRSEALAAYEQARKAVVEELGLDPGPLLRDLQQRIIEADPALEVPAPARAPVSAPDPAAAGRAPAAPRTVRRDLPRDLDDFTGRDSEIALVVAGLSAETEHAGPGPVVVWTLDGMAGVGKTALAVRLAHRLSAAYPDGQYFVDLHAHSADHEPVSASAALEKLLRASGVAAGDVPADPEDRAALWRSRLAGTRTLIVLDNAAGAAHIRHLLPGAPGSLVLVTSRRRLTGVDAALSLTLDVLPRADAVGLFTSIVGDARPAAEPEAVTAVVGLCGCLPLAVRIAAARLRHRPAWTVAHLRDRLGDEHRRLAELQAEDRGVAAAFTLSYRTLGADARQLFRRLGLIPGPVFDAPAAAALAGGPAAATEDLLERLVDAHLVEQPSMTVFRLHDLTASFARERCRLEETGESRRSALGRLLDYYLHTTNHAEDLIRPGRLDRGPDAPDPAAARRFADRDAALAWLDGERPNLVAVVAAADDNGFPEHAWRIPRQLWGYFENRRLWAEWTACSLRALPNTRLLGDRLAEARTRVALGVCANDLRHYDEAIAHYLAAAALMRELGFRAGQAGALSNLANTYRRLGRYAEGVACLEEAREALHETDDRFTEAVMLMNLGELRREAGTPADSLAPLEQALRITRAQRFRRLEGSVLDGLAHALLVLGRPEEAVRHCRLALAARVESDDRFGEAVTLDCLGQALAALGREDETAQSWSRALAVFESLGAPEAADLRARMLRRFAAHPEAAPS